MTATNYNITKGVLFNSLYNYFGRRTSLELDLNSTLSMVDDIFATLACEENSQCSIYSAVDEDFNHIYTYSKNDSPLMSERASDFCWNELLHLVKHPQNQSVAIATVLKHDDDWQFGSVYVTSQDFYNAYLAIGTPFIFKHSFSYDEIKILYHFWQGSDVTKTELESYLSKFAFIDANILIDAYGCRVCNKQAESEEALKKLLDEDPTVILSSIRKNNTSNAMRAMVKFE